MGSGDIGARIRALADRADELGDALSAAAASAAQNLITKLEEVISRAEAGEEEPEPAAEEEQA